MRKFVLPFTLSLLAWACSTKEKITNPADYTVYVQNKNTGKNLSSIDSEIVFWQKRLNKIQDDIISRSKLAGLLENRFSYSGNINELHDADSLYKLVNPIQSLNSSGTFRALAANCIRQHKFQQAKWYIDSALALGDDRYLTTLMEFDIAMELGNRFRANKVLRSFANKNDFDYLIRLAKYKDHIEGNLEEAIILMEKALKEVENNRTLYRWTKSNLGDMYGHANRLKESYQCFLDVLAEDPEYYHALKGIAWIAFARDKNVREGKKIIEFLQQQHRVPEYDLLLAEIAAFENNEAVKEYHLGRFSVATRNSAYGNMYNKYLFNLHADEWNNAGEALSIAKKEIGNRATPEVFSWLAWAYFKTGNIDKALKIAKGYVEKKCFEPGVLYRMGIIYKASGQKDKAKEFLTSARSSAFELGPLAEKEITKVLQSL
jgi:tetratricopeptide (TPR) repeat protein